MAYHKASAHRSEEKSVDSDRLSCDFCPLTFSRMQRYIQHCNKKHLSELENTWLHCGECRPAIYFPSEKVLKNHHRIAHTRIENKNDPTFSQKVKHRKCPFCPREIYNTGLNIFQPFLLTFCLVMLTRKLKKSEALPVWYFKFLFFCFFRLVFETCQQRTPWSCFNTLAFMWNLSVSLSDRESTKTSLLRDAQEPEARRRPKTNNDNKKINNDTWI